MQLIILDGVHIGDEYFKFLSKNCLYYKNTFFNNNNNNIYKNQII